MTPRIPEEFSIKLIDSVYSAKTRIASLRFVPRDAGPAPTHERLGPNDCENLKDERKPAIQLDKEPAIMVREPDATMQATPQNNQLMSKHRVLGFKP
jgi:hypothetical protein